MLDPAIVESLVHPVRDSELTPSEEDLLQLVAEGRPIKAIAAAREMTPAAASEAVERLFLKLAQLASAGTESSLRRLRLLHEAIVAREEQGETLSRLLPGGLAEKVRTEGHRIGETERLNVTVVISDIRGYSTLVGDTVNLAQRLQQWAEPGQTVLSEPTCLALQDGAYRLEPLEPALVKGRNAPVRACLLEG